jgi:hypothetical protein
MDKIINRLSEILILILIVLLSGCNADVDLPEPVVKTSTQQPRTKVKIEYPIPESKVPFAERIQGTSQLLPENQKIWIVIFPLAANSYYPQDRYADVQPDGKWQTVAYIGIKDQNIGEVFDVIAVLVDSDAFELFKRYSKESKEKQEWVGLENLPDGATVYDRITVVRK